MNPAHHKASFFLDTGEEINGSYAVVPIFTQDLRTNIMYFVATGFYITPYGHVTTAKHVVMKDEKTPHDPLFIFHFYGENKYLIRKISNVVIANDGDVAICETDQYTHNKTGQQMRNKVLSITLDTPKIGEKVAAFAYPKTTVKREEEYTAIHCDTSWHHGEILEHFPIGRDRIMLPTECFRTSIELPGGSSGGPVMDERGRVFGIVSTGWEGTPQESFVSSIRRILSMRLKNTSLPDGTKNPAINQLMSLGFISIK